MCIYIYTYINVYLSLSIHIYIYIYIYSAGPEQARPLRCEITPAPSLRPPPTA